MYAMNMSTGKPIQLGFIEISHAQLKIEGYAPEVMRCRLTSC